MTRDGLILKFFPDTDGLGELEVTARSKGFSGRSSAWFGTDQLQGFATALGAFPLGEEARRGIASGYWKTGTTTVELDEVHVSVSVYQTSRRGSLGVRVRLATPIGSWSRPEERHAVEMEIATTYSALASFAAQLSRLAAGATPEAVLHADEAT